jgi:hypothetical protein
MFTAQAGVYDINEGAQSPPGVDTFTASSMSLTSTSIGGTNRWSKPCA